MRAVAHRSIRWAVVSTVVALAATGATALAVPEGDEATAPQESVVAAPTDEPAADEQLPPVAPDDAVPAPDSSHPPTDPASTESNLPPAGADGSAADGEGSGSGDPASTDAGATASADVPGASTAATGEETGATPATSPGPVATAEQAVTVTGIAVSVATTGSNRIEATETSPAPGEGAGGGAAHVQTGPANAVGTRDRTSVEQQAVTVLSGEATADVLQVVLVFNIGAALANSGINAVSAGGGTSDASVTSTGSALAVGNAARTYLTQAGAANAAGGGLDTSRQLAVSLRLGIAVADSGSNAIVASGSAGGGLVQSGGASAVGNESITEISQNARATGSGTAHLTIAQRAIVLNMGVAMANSGVNELRGVAGSLLSATPDDVLTEQLFALLLPSLLASYEAEAAGAGTVSTGAATAIGNLSATYIDQTASATASGDGTASVEQQVIVANVGAALANTGGNRHGGAAGDAVPLDDRTRLVVAELASYLGDLVAEINGWNPGSARASSSLSLPLGDILVGIESTLTGSLLELEGAGVVSGTAGSRVRQVTAIINLGIARANTGENTTVSIVVGPDAVAVAADVRIAATNSTTLVTGDALARNTSLVIVCQLDDSPDHPCLRPTSEEGEQEEDAGTVSPGTGNTAPPAAVTPIRRAPVPNDLGVPTTRPGGPPATVRGQLPATGSDIQVMLALGAALVIVGGALTRVRRRPEA